LQNLVLANVTDLSLLPSLTSFLFTFADAAMHVESELRNGGQQRYSENTPVQVGMPETHDTPDQRGNGKR
jgi:hypothetical protein